MVWHADRGASWRLAVEPQPGVDTRCHRFHPPRGKAAPKQRVAASARPRHQPLGGSPRSATIFWIPAALAPSNAFPINSTGMLVLHSMRKRVGRCSIVRRVSGRKRPQPSSEAARRSLQIFDAANEASSMEVIALPRICVIPGDCDHTRLYDYINRLALTKSSACLAPFRTPA